MNREAPRRSLLTGLLLLLAAALCFGLLPASVEPSKPLAPVRDRDAEELFERVHSFADGAKRRYSISYAVPRRAVEDSERVFGYRQNELHERLKQITVDFEARHPGCTIRLQENGAYRITHNGRDRTLPEKYRTLYQATRRAYFDEHLIAITDRGMRPDYRAVQAWQAPSLRPLYETLEEIGRAQHMSERQFIGLLAGFVQDLEYKVPPKSTERVTLGFWPPLVCLKEKGGDCDSKSTLFAALYSHYRRDSCILVITKRHAFIGIKGQHKLRPGDEMLTIGGVDYLLIEMTGHIGLGRVAKAELEKIRKGEYTYVVFH
jgi:hypothetical protein